MFVSLHLQKYALFSTHQSFFVLFIFNDTQNNVFDTLFNCQYDD